MKAKRTLKLSVGIILAVMLAVFVGLGVSTVTPARAEATSVNTEVAGVKIWYNGGNTRIGFKFTVDDMPETRVTDGEDKNVSFKNYLVAYNTLKNILLYTSETEYVTLESAFGSDAWFNYGQIKCLGFDLNNDAWSTTNIVKVVIKAGCEFPSFENYKSEPLASKYVTTKTMQYVSSATSAVSTDYNAWTGSEVVEEEDDEDGTVVNTEVAGVKIWYNGGNTRIGMKFTVDDMPETRVTDGEDKNVSFKNYLASYNTLQNILLYTNDTEYVTLESAFGSDAWFNYGQIKCMGFDLNNAAWSTTNIVKIVINAGCEFPSFENYKSEPLASKYVTTKTMQYVSSATSAVSTDYNAWTGSEVEDVEIEEVEAIVRDTAVTSLALKDGQHFAFALTAHDNNNGWCQFDNKYLNEFNYAENILLYTSETEYKTLEEYRVGGAYEAYYGYNGAGSVSFKVDGGVPATIVKVVVPAGTEFPAAGYTGSFRADGRNTTPTTTTPTMYKTTEEIVFVKNQFGFANLADAPEQENAGYRSVTGAQFNLKAHLNDGNDNILAIWVANSDYGTAFEGHQNIEAGAVTASLNTLDYITVNGTKLSEMLNPNTTSNIIINRWQRWETISFTLETFNADTCTVNDVTEVVVKAGCQLPTYLFASQGFVEYYTVEYDTIFQLYNGNLYRMYSVTIKQDANDEGTTTLEMSGSLLTAPSFTKEGYEISKWVDQDGDEWVFETNTVAYDMVLTPVWVEATPEEPVEPEEPGNSEEPGESTGDNTSTNEEDDGCFAGIGAGTLGAIVMIAGAVAIIRKRKE